MSITCRLNTAKLRQPLPPASTTVVTPARKVNPSGGTARGPLLYSLFRSGPWNTWVWMSTSPGTTTIPAARTTVGTPATGMSGLMRAILPPAMATSNVPSMRLRASSTRPPLMTMS